MLKFLAYFGALLILCGLSIYTVTEWNSINTGGKIIITLGSGIVFFILAAMTLFSGKLLALSTPFLILSSIFETLGLYVTLYEFNYLVEPNITLCQLFVSGVMFFQMFIYWLTSQSKQNTSVFFFVVFFGSTLMLSIFNLFWIKSEYASIILGVSLMCITYSITESKYKVLVPWGYFFGSSILLSGLYTVIDRSAFDYLYFIVAGAVIYLSTLVKSKTLLFIGTLNLMIYIGFFTAKHFINSISWPLLLIALGFMLVLASAVVYSINKKIKL